MARQSDRDMAALHARQARVGIIANPAKMRLPSHLPRDIWTRWPDLRSKRRLQKQGKADRPEKRFADPVLDGELLDDLMSEYRERRPARMGSATLRALGLSGSAASGIAASVLSRTANWLATIGKSRTESPPELSAKPR